VSWCWGPALLGGVSTKRAEGEDAEEKDTVRGTNGVVKGIAVKGRMITENSLRPHEGSMWVPVQDWPPVCFSALGVRDHCVFCRPRSTTPPSQTAKHELGHDKGPNRSGLVASRDTWRHARRRLRGNKGLGHAGAHEAASLHGINPLSARKTLCRATPQPTRRIVR
jgi:hypothetical protein